MIRVAALCLALTGGAVLAQDALATRTAAAAARLSEAEQLFAAAPHSDAPVATLVSAMRAYEDGLIAVRAGLRDTTAQYDDLRETFTTERAQVAQLLSALQTVSQRPAPTLAVHPAGVTQTVQARLLAAHITPALQADADRLRGQLNALTKLRALQQTGSETLTVGVAGKVAAEEALRQALLEAPPHPERFVANTEAVATLADEAQSLGAFVDALHAIYRDSLPGDGAIAAAASLPLPVVGRVLPPSADDDTKAPGWVLAAPAGGLVVAPTTGTVLSQGPLLSFDAVIVLAPTPTTTLIFAGLEESLVRAGHTIPAGWPLGRMARDHPPTDAKLTRNLDAETGSASQALYLEVRDGQTPVDPATWFALEQQMDNE